MVDMHLEVDVIPVSDVERSKKFHERWGGDSTMTSPRQKNPVLVFQRLPSLLGMSTPTWRHGPTTASPQTP